MIAAPADQQGQVSCNPRHPSQFLIQCYLWEPVIGLNAERGKAAPIAALALLLLAFIHY